MKEHLLSLLSGFLNQISFLSVLSKETLNGSSFRYADALTDAITAFVNEHNEKAKPFVWKKKEVKGSQLRNIIVT